VKAHAPAFQAPSGEEGCQGFGGVTDLREEYRDHDVVSRYERLFNKWSTFDQFGVDLVTISQRRMLIDFVYLGVGIFSPLVVEAFVQNRQDGKRV
jgi:hypothetical protein